MIARFVLPALAVVGFGIGILAALKSAQTTPPAAMVARPPAPPYSQFVAGAGLVESNTENIAIGTHIAGIVSQIYVSIGSTVKKGDPLFTIDDRATRATLASQQAAVKVAEAHLAQAEYELKIGTGLVGKHVISAEDAELRKYAVAIANAQLVQAQAQVAATQVELERLTVHAPIDGDVLQLKIHLGEFAPTSILAQALVLLGNVTPLCVRVNVDENDAWRVRPGATAMGYLRGNRQIKTPLHFVRFEPYVIPKLSLTGASTERVDTRVLQAIYSFDRGDLPIFVGQQMDVYIDAGESPAASEMVKP